MSENHSINNLGDFGGGNALVMSDAIALVERIPSGAVELCYIDPPLFPQIDSSFAKDSTQIMREHLLALAKVLQQTRRCLLARGNVFVHSEPEMNGSIRLLLDQVFGRENFRQEIVVPRRALRNRGGLGSGHDTVFHYSFGPDFIFNRQTRDLTQKEIAQDFSSSDERGPFRVVSLVSRISRPNMAFEWKSFQPRIGSSWVFSRDRLDQLYDEGRIVLSPSGNAPRMKQYASESARNDVGTVWDDMPLRVPPRESADYPTQKPKRLMERIVAMGSQEGGLVLDPFCGSGTTLVVANKSNRRWIGGDNSHIAISLATKRLHDECQLAAGEDFVSMTEELLRKDVGRQSVPNLRIATGFDDLVIGPVGSLVFGKPMDVEESREYEFKEVSSARPLESIANTADEYAVAFLNSEGGRIYWGVRDSDRIVVGLTLASEDRDRLRQKVTNKLVAIRPAIDPTAYRLEFHPVEHPDGIPNLVVVELVVPKVKSSTPYYTGGNESFVRLDGVKHKLVGPELSEWIIRRISNG